MRDSPRLAKLIWPSCYDILLSLVFTKTKCNASLKLSPVKLCNGVETVSKFTYLRDRLNATGGFEMAVTVRSRIGWVKFRECSEILKAKGFDEK